MVNYSKILKDYLLTITSITPNIFINIVDEETTGSYITIKRRITPENVKGQYYRSEITFTINIYSSTYDESLDQMVLIFNNLEHNTVDGLNHLQITSIDEGFTTDEMQYIQSLTLVCD